MSTKEFKRPVDLDPEAPGLDEETRVRRRALAKLQQLSPRELFELAVRAGIYTPDGERTEPYRPSGEEIRVADNREPVDLDPEAPGLDEDTRARRRALAKLQQLSPRESFELAVRAGIYTPDGRLTDPYRPDGEPSAHRPTD